MFYPRGRGRQWSWKGQRKKKKSLPGRESFNSSFKREAGAARAQNGASVIGVSPFTWPQEAENPLPAPPRPLPSAWSRLRSPLEPPLVWHLAGCRGTLGFLLAEGGRASGMAGWAWLWSPRCHLSGVVTWVGFRLLPVLPSSLTTANPTWYVKFSSGPILGTVWLTRAWVR